MTRRSRPSFRALSLPLGLALLVSACGSSSPFDGVTNGVTDEVADEVATRSADESAIADGAVADAVPASDAEQGPSPDGGFYAMNVASLDGEAADLADYRGKVTLVVNVASQCGYTPQYAGLQALHQELAGEGFAVLGFPSNDFGGQEPGTATEIRSFCTSNYGVTFPLFEKVQTRSGAGQSEVYGRLEELAGALPNWNF